EGRFDIGCLFVSLVEDEPIAQRKRLAGRNGVRTVDSGRRLEIMQAEWISGEQTVVAHMPGGRITKTARVIQEGDAHDLAADGPVIINPPSPLTPGRFVGLSFAVDDLAALLARDVHHSR